MTPVKGAFAVCLAAAMFFAGYLSNGRPTPAPVSAATRVSYSCPMHPDYKAAQPGDCPVCGMRLENVSENGAAALAGKRGTVKISGAQQQLIGVRTEVVQETSGSTALRLLGRVAPDASRVYRLIAATDGWVRELGRNPAGAVVSKGETLASYFVRDLVSAQQNYLYAYQMVAAQNSQANVAPQRNTPTLNLRLALDTLRSLGMTDAEIEQLQKKGQPAPDMHVYAPGAGVVLARNISPDQRFDKGAELYRIADLSRVWVLADVFEKDRDLVNTGAGATVRYGGREYRARPSDLLPEFDPQSRTLKMKLEVENPGYVLRPDMFVEVEMQARTAHGLAVPSEAILDSGLRRIVYIDRGNGEFEPRQVKTDGRIGERVVIADGLRPGDRIVVSGGFMIDSESRLRTVAQPTVEEAGTAIASARDPVCGMEVDAAAAAAPKSQYGGASYTFCSPKCKRDFEASPATYAMRRRP